MVPVVIGALLVICGLLFMARTAIFRGDMSEAQHPAVDPGSVTLEPERRGLRFLGLKANWPGTVLIVVGVLMLLLGAFA